MGRDTLNDINHEAVAQVQQEVGAAPGLLNVIVCQVPPDPNGVHGVDSDPDDSPRAVMFAWGIDWTSALMPIGSTCEGSAFSPLQIISRPTRQGRKPIALHPARFQRRCWQSAA